MKRIPLFIIGLSLSACASQLEFGPSSVPVVPVSAVIDAIKCGLAKAVQADRNDRTGLNGATAAVSLDVNVIEGRNSSGGLSAGIPVFQGAGTITPSFSITHSETRTLNSSVDFDILISAGGKSICAGRNYQIEQDEGFSAWIGQVVVGINDAMSGRPYAQMTQYTYESDFAVKTDVTGGLEIAIVPVKLNTSLGSSRSDVQHMKVDIKPVHLITLKGGGKKVAPRSRPWFVEPKPAIERRGSFNIQ